MASGLVRQLVFSQWRYWPGWHHSHLPHDDVVLDEDEVAFLEALARGELAARLGDDADVLVAHDGGLVVRRVLVELDVGAADAADLHLHQRAVGRDVRHRVFADLGLARAGPDGRQHFLCHVSSLRYVVAGLVRPSTSMPRIRL